MKKLIVLALCALAAPAAASVKVVASVPDLAALVRACSHAAAVCRGIVGIVARGDRLR